MNYHDILDFLRECLTLYSTHTLEVSRDFNDSYKLNFQTLHENSQYSLKRSDVMGVIPTGSSWSYLLGWRDIFGIPVTHEAQVWIAFGAETALEHKSRGAYLYTKSFLVPFPFKRKMLNELIEFSFALSVPDDDSLVPWNNRLEYITRGSTTVVANHRSIVEHQPVEGWIIRKALQEYLSGNIITFRTLRIKKMQAPMKWHPHILSEVPSISKDPGYCS